MRTESVKTFARRTSYALALASLTYFIARQGLAPWQVLTVHWQAFAVSTGIISIAIVIQSIVFIACASERSSWPSLMQIIRIWAAGGVTSFIAPFAVGIAVRITLLKQRGIAVRDSSLATLRQLLFNMQFSLYGAIIATLFSPEPVLQLTGILLVVVALIWTLSTNYLSKKPNLHLFGIFRTSEVLKPIAHNRKAWLGAQLAIMSLNNYCCYNFLGAKLSCQESVILSAISIWSSVVAFIPHGMGILDTLWIWLARSKGLDTAHSTAIAMILRFSYISGSLLTFLLSTIQIRFTKSS